MSPSRLSVDRRAQPPGPLAIFRRGRHPPTPTRSHLRVRALFAAPESQGPEVRRLHRKNRSALLTKCKPTLTLRLRQHEVCKTVNGGEIKFAVLESPSCELARFRRTQ